MSWNAEEIEAGAEAAHTALRAKQPDPSIVLPYSKATEDVKEFFRVAVRAALPVVQAMRSARVRQNKVASGERRAA